MSESGYTRKLSGIHQEVSDITGVAIRIFGVQCYGKVIFIWWGEGEARLSLRDDILGVVANWRNTLNNGNSWLANGC